MLVWQVYEAVCPTIIDPELTRKMDFPWIPLKTKHFGLLVAQENTKVHTSSPVNDKT
jgi:hypothetical protein